MTTSFPVHGEIGTPFFNESEAVNTVVQYDNGVHRSAQPSYVLDVEPIIPCVRLPVESMGIKNSIGIQAI